jgi:diguanylate cyclase (GGDEF)-like protein
MADAAPRLLHAVRALNESLDPSRVLVRVCVEAARLLDAERAGVFLGDPVGGFRLEAVYGGPGHLIGETLGREDGLVRQVLKRGKPAGAADELAVPIRWGGQLRGVLALSGVREPEPDALELLDAYGELAAAACRNASTHLELALAARTDGLTGCLNHAAMHEALHREFERAARHGEPLSLVILDLDDFKQVNEVHGHLAGDEVLRRVGAALRASVRAYDLVARYGGDEFAIIAIDAGEDTAAEVAQRAVETIRGEVASLGSGDITAATAGVAEWRQGDTPSTLIARADGALLGGKHEGGRGGVLRSGRG